MNRYTTFLLGLCVIIFSMQSCFNEIIGISGSGQIKTEIRAVTDFEEVELNISGDVEITKDSTISLEVSDYENLLPHIRTYVHGNMLTIEHDPKNVILRNSEAKIKIKIPSLTNLIVNGSGKISVLSGFDGLNNINISGSGNVIVADSFNTSRLRVVISGSGNVTAIGRADQLNTNISGSGNINLYGVVAQDATCLISGSGNTYIYVEQNLNASISGSGNIIYMGNPELTVNISGSGTVRSR